MASYWLMKCEFDECSFEELTQRPEKMGYWRGVRNYEARNNIRSMKAGDQVLFYQSNCSDPGIAGIARVSGDPYPDPSAFDPADKYYDPKSSPESPRWFSVDIAPILFFRNYVSLNLLKANETFSDMRLVKRGQRLSVHSVDGEHFKEIKKMGRGRKV